MELLERIRKLSEEADAVRSEPRNEQSKVAIKIWKELREMKNEILASSDPALRAAAAELAEKGREFFDRKSTHNRLSS